MRIRLPKRRIPGLHQRLVAGGWFQKAVGPFGGCPVQLYGRLHNGECVYFRARGRFVELEISSPDDHHFENPHRRFKEEVFIDHELGAGVLPTSVAVEFIEKWLTEYLGEKPAEKKRRTMGRIAQWWSSIEDKQLFGTLFSFAVTGGFRLAASRKVDMFHNGNRPVAGVALQFGPLVLHLSSAKSWS